METLLSRIRININERIYLKDPESSELGKKIVSVGIDLIEKNGFENFTFKKLAEKINSTEASIYRYFESKQKLLIYLTSWYWSWMEYRLVMKTSNIVSAEKRLMIALNLICSRKEATLIYSYINIQKLNKIVICESQKSYLIKEVDKVNKEGAFLSYKQFVKRVAELVKEVAPNYKYPHMLISTVVESVHHQSFFASHLPALTDKVNGEIAIEAFCSELVLKTLKK